MTQFGALIWLKWKLFRNALRSRRGASDRVASALGMLAALAFALLVATGLGFAAYGMASLESSGDARAITGEAQGQMPFLFTIFAAIYLMWATIPLSVGGGGRFDPGNLLLYPISLRKLFAIDFLSDLTNLSSVFAIPAVIALALGAGLAQGRVLMALPVALMVVACGMALAKWLAASLAALMRKERSRGEMVLGLVGAVAGLSGAFVSQFMILIERRPGSLHGLRWTPPGAAAVALLDGLGEGGAGDYALSLATLAAYSFTLIVVTYWIARRTALNVGGAKRATTAGARANDQLTRPAGWQLPLVSSEFSAVLEKELRYAMRDAQLRTMGLMTLALIGLRLVQPEREGRRGALPLQLAPFAESFAPYAEGLLAAAGVLYIFMLLSSFICNLFAYEGDGMRTLILSPLERRTILVAKNVGITFVAFIFVTVLAVIDQIIFRDLSTAALVFAALCFVIFAFMFALVGNSLSMRLPKRMEFGRRMKVSGLTGWLLIPIALTMATPPLLSAVAGWMTRSLAVKYATLMMFAGAAAALYGLLIKRQGRALARRELDILEAVKSRDEG